VSVRMMLPFTIQCSTCSSFMYRGRKFNSKKEAVGGSQGKYLGIQRFRFYIKCAACSRPVTFLTDPQNADYEMETGGTRTFEVHKDRDKTKENVLEEERKVEKEDAMKALEKRVLASQQEMADLDNLDEIKAMNMRHLKMMAMAHGTGGQDGGAGGADATSMILNAHHHIMVEEKDPLELDETDEALIKSIKFGSRSTADATSVSMSRLTEAQEDEMQRRREMEQVLMEKQQMELVAKVKAQKQAAASALNPLIKVKRKRRIQGDDDDIAKKQQKNSSTPTKMESKSQPIPIPKPSENANALGLLAGYGSDSDSD